MKNLRYHFAAIFIIAFSFFVSSCKDKTVIEEYGIRNFHQVEENIYRGEQPGINDWDTLKALLITDIIKLNTDDEGDDSPAEKLGMKVHRFPITWQQQMGIVKIDPVIIDRIISLIKPHTYIHCEWGKDRTGIIVALYRLKKGWTWNYATNEMLGYGFDKRLTGLWHLWEKKK